MFKKILVPLDGSALAERAIEQVEKMGKGAVAEAILLKVVPAPLGKAPEAGQMEESKAFTERRGPVDGISREDRRPARGRYP